VRPLAVGIPAGLVVGVLLGPVPTAAQPPEVASLITAMRAAYATVADYTATFVKRERLDGKLGDTETIQLKFRKPNSIYMRWTQGRAAGREIIVVEGRDDDRALIHEPKGVRSLVTIVVAPDHPLVLKQSRHPITDVGLGRLIELLETGTRSAVAWKELPTAGEPAATAATRQIELKSSRPVGNCSCQRAIVTLDAATHLPVAADTFDENDDPIGMYRYRDLDLNPPLTARDFDPTNADYGFPRARLPL
jgi:outer membrane lipoprotein-sorting protein